MKNNKKKPFKRDDEDERDEKDEDEDDGKEKSVKHKLDVKKAVSDIDAVADELDGGEGEENDMPTGLAARINKAVRAAVASIIKGSDSDDTSTLVDDDEDYGKFDTGFGNPKDNKGAKNKKKVNTHEGMERDSQEDNDEESDEADGESAATGSAPSGEGAGNAVKRRRHTGLPDQAFKSRKQAETKGNDEEELAKAGAEEMMEELADDENFSEVVEASDALRTLSNVVVKSIARIEARQIMMGKALAKSLRVQNDMIKSINPDAFQSEDEEGNGDGKSRVRKSADGGGTRRADPGMIAIIDGKEVMIKLPAGTPTGGNGFSKSISADMISKTREKLNDLMNEGEIDPNILVAFDARGFSALEQQLGPEFCKSKGIDLPRLN